MPAPGAARRICGRCTRPVTACICRWIVPVHTGVELLILQHPMETSNAKGSARLLHLSVAGSVLAEGEEFDPDRLAAFLHAGDRAPLLLYPETPGDAPGDAPTDAPPATAPGLASRATPAIAQERDPALLRLVIIDATWRKSRKMLYLNAALQGLPRLALTQVPPSHYLIRKAHLPNQLSTLEATCHALAQLDDGASGLAPLLAAFDDFVARFQATGGRIGT